MTTIDAGEAAVRAFIAGLPKGDRSLVRSWLDAGYDGLTALTSAGVLVGSQARRHPRQLPPDEETARARLHGVRATTPAERIDRETAEHESAHCWAALGLGYGVESVTMEDQHGNGGCLFETPEDRLDYAAIVCAGELWISLFRSSEWPGGASGCRLDRLDAARLVDNVDLLEARRRAHRVLRIHGADVHALADRLQRDRFVKL